MTDPATSSTSALNGSSPAQPDLQSSGRNARSTPQAYPKDGARTLLDAVTAYQRRTARPRAERGLNLGERKTHNPSNSPGPTSLAHQQRPSDPPETSKTRADSRTFADSRNSPRTAVVSSSEYVRKNVIESEFSRGPPMFPSGTEDFDHAKDPSFRSARHVPSSGRHSGSSPQLKKNGTSRNLAMNSSVPAIHTSKLFDPNAKAPHPKEQIDKSRQAHLNTGSTYNIRSDSQDSKKPRKPPARGSTGEARQLFDPRRHDPVKFAASKRNSERGTNPTTPSIAEGELPPSLVKHHTYDRGNKGTLHQGEEEANKTSLLFDLKQSYKRIVSLETALKEEEHSAKAKDEELKTREIREIREGQSNSNSALFTNSASLLRSNTKQKQIQEDYWVRLAKQHRDLAEAHLNFLELALDPRLPSSAQGLPQKHSTPQRLWQTAFHQLLERLRHAAIPQPAALSNSEPNNQHLLDHLTDFIYFAYGFYTALLEEQRLAPFRSVWLEQLGDLARYRMAVAGIMSKKIVNQTGRLEASRSRLSTEQTEVSDKKDYKLSRRGLRRNSRRNCKTETEDSQTEEEISSRGGFQSPSCEVSLVQSRSLRPALQKHAPRQAAASIGLAALGSWEFEEQEIWRATAKDWYSKGLAETPGSGRLHHHLALLSKGDELRTLYHYCKSLTAASPYLPARESILPFFESEHQSRRSRPEVSINDLFVHLHGMLFTKIQLDDFDKELARFMERLTEDRLLFEKQSRSNLEIGCHPSLVFAQSTMSDVNWMMMAAVNICALLQYGAEDGIIRVSHQSNHKAPHESQQHHYGAKSQKESSGSSKPQAMAPQAILLNHQPSGSMSVEKGSENNPCLPGQSVSSDDGLSSSVENHSEVSSTYNQSDHHTLTPGAEGRDAPSTSMNHNLKGIVIKVSDLEENSKEEEPIVFTLAAKLSFAMLDDVLQTNHRDRLCPYLTMILTFLGSMCQNEKVMRKLEPFIPWAKLTEFFNRIPDSVLVRVIPVGPEGNLNVFNTSFKLTGFPLLEDWCLRGMEWTGNHLFGRGFWKLHKTSGRGSFSAEVHTSQSKLRPGNWNIESEIDVLVGLSGGLEVDCLQPEEQHEILQSRRCVQGDCSYQQSTSGPADLNKSSGHGGSDSKSDSDFKRFKSDVRWKRVALVACWISRTQARLVIDNKPNSKQRFAMCNALLRRLKRWEDEARQQDEAQRKSQVYKSNKDRQIAEIDEEIDRRTEAEEDDDDDDDPCDSELVRSLKARRRELKAMLRQTQKPAAKHTTSAPKPSRFSKPMQQRQTQNKVNALPGYTVLVFDTNILIGMLSIVKDLLDSEQFTIIIPLVVITELDGLKKGTDDVEHSRRLGQEALEAIKYLEGSIKSKSKWLKIQTSQGNYLRDLSIRNEEIKFRSQPKGKDDTWISTNAARNLDDLVLRATMWQLEHFSQRLIADQSATGTPEKVVLVTLDRNLRLKARARGIVAADEKEIIALVSSTKSKLASDKVKG